MINIEIFRMKRLFLVVLAVHAVHVSAQDYPMINSFKGPVKQATITMQRDNGDANLYYGGTSGARSKTVCWYDSIGRLLEEANYMDDEVQRGYVCQYTINNVYMQYNYDANGVIQGSFARFQLDSLGNLLESKRYEDGKFLCGDSTVYDADGRKIEFYETHIKSKKLMLRYIYVYDSIGRLCKVSDLFHGTGHVYTIEYFPNGSYTQHHIDNKGKKWDIKFILDKKGQLTRMESSNMSCRYSHFDKYGNWLQLISTNNTPVGQFTTITERVIEYYE